MSTSTLHCPPTLVVARHARAEYVESWFSDEGGSLTHEGRRQARALGESLLDRRVAAVWTSDVSRAVQTAEIVAASLGIGVTACKSLREVFIGDLLGQPFDVARLHEVCDRWHAGDLDARFPGGESGRDVVARHVGQLDHIADQHLGETVLVVGHQLALGIVLPTLAAGAAGAPDASELANAACVELVRSGGSWLAAGPAQT
ncbi:MAG: histidine phosphatase family protein [Marmoricola sp.]|nr:histidine phosphatase family protein [Marmoricola sp.]